jgi:thiol-disulfide isomerase/thioredoxin
MKQLLLIFSIVGAFSILAQQPITVEISGNIFNTTEDSVKISQYFGTHYVDHIKGKFDKNGDYKLKGKLPAQDYYVLRVGTQHMNVILRNGSKIRINADGKNITAYHTITGSDETVALNEIIVELQRFNMVRDSAMAELQKHPEKQEEINKNFQQDYMRFTSYRQSFIAKNANSPALLPAMSTLDLDKEFAIYEAIVKQLSDGFSGSPTIENVKQQFNEAKLKKASQNLLAPGKPAPNFTQNDVNGKPLSLADLKGKVVLIDFWASWCGPCRKENPNVVKLYEKYKDAGFTIMSVSLDKDKSNWLAAIEKDNLVWPYHVSDLKQWSNEVARLYQVSSIPFTVLVDKNGNIIDTKLRGVELEQALKTIFGF